MCRRKGRFAGALLRGAGTQGGFQPLKNNVRNTFLRMSSFVPSRE